MIVICSVFTPYLGGFIVRHKCERMREKLSKRRSSRLACELLVSGQPTNTLPREKHMQEGEELSQLSSIE